METSLSSKIVLGSQITLSSYKRVAYIVSQIDHPPYFHIKQQLTQPLIYLSISSLYTKGGKYRHFSILNITKSVAN